MKKIIPFIVLTLFSLIYFRCVDDISVVDTSKKHSGKLVLKSEPDSAEIFLLGTNTNKVTPDSILNLESGSYNVTLKLNHYFDTTFTSMVFDNLRTEDFIILRSFPKVTAAYINSTPPNAEIFLSGKSTNKFTPDSLIGLNEGDYSVTLKLPGYKDTTFVLILDKNKITTEDITLTKADFGGSILIESDPSNAEIFFQGENTNKFTPDSISNLKEGSYQITLKLQGYRDSTFTAVVVDNNKTIKNITLSDSIPAVSVTLSYSKIQFGQILFNFSFNQDIYLDTVKVLKPGADSTSTFNFGNEYIGEGDQRLLIFSEALQGIWSFTFLGSKAEGLRSKFSIIEDIDVK